MPIPAAGKSCATGTVAIGAEDASAALTFAVAGATRPLVAGAVGITAWPRTARWIAASHSAVAYCHSPSGSQRSLLLAPTMVPMLS
jgi:hypothetical protein